MQAPPSVMRPHWIPVHPSWLVATGLILLGALPHQVPAAGRRFLQNPMGGIAFAGISAWVAWRSPVLGVAMFLFLAGVWISAPMREGFVSPVLNKDSVNRRRLWHSEEIMTEMPEMIQELTTGPGFLKDVVDTQAHKWEVETTLEENPVGIQDRPVADLPDYMESQPSHHS
jgi:hypothetical protein